MNHILFITTHNLATNPRIVKEIKLANNLGYKTSLICFEFENWSKSINDQILSELNFNKLITIPAGRNKIFSWLKSVLLEKIFRGINYIFPLPIKFLSYAHSRRSVLLLNAINEIEKVDLVIGHNPGAIYATFIAAKQFNCKAGFDMEDYHPGEGNDSYLQKITLTLMKKLLPKFNYVSFASQSILTQCKESINHLPIDSSFVINNCFPSNEFLEPLSISDNRLQLVWFSQQINISRGLEQLIPVVNRNEDKFNLTLFGDCNAHFKNQFLDKQKGIQLGGVLPQKMLHQKLSAFDIGLALEPGKDLNNELALSNKILAYLQSGLFIIATDTMEQLRLFNKEPNFGITLDKKLSNLEKTLLQLHKELAEIRKSKITRFVNGKELAWENESLILSNIWNSLLIALN
jgi:hypothetical protein